METCRQLTSQMASSLLDSPPSLFFQGGFFNQFNKEDLLNLICGVTWIVSLVSSVLLISTWSKTQKHSGLYGCEVSADFPEYDTDIRRAHLHVFGETSIMYKDGLFQVNMYVFVSCLYFVFAIYLFLYFHCWLLDYGAVYLIRVCLQFRRKVGQWSVGWQRGDDEEWSWTFWWW